MRIFIIGLVAALLSAQTPLTLAQAPANANRYTATASTTKLTVQQPASNANQVYFETASVYCASACAITPSWNGTAATATTLAIIKSPGTQQPAAATAWSGSNVGSGTTGVVYNIPAGATLVFDMSTIVMGTTGTATNFTLASDQTATISMTWREK